MQKIGQIVRTMTRQGSRFNGPLLPPATPTLRRILRVNYKGEVMARGKELDAIEALRVTEIAEAWITGCSASNPWLFLSGSVGTGKTTLMRAMRTTLELHDIPCKMFKASDLRALFIDNVEETDRCLLQGNWCRVLFIDDIGVEQGEIKYYGNVIQPFIKVVEERYNRRLPMVVSTNLSGEEIKARYGVRTIDRIRELATALTYEGRKSFRI